MPEKARRPAAPGRFLGPPWVSVADPRRASDEVAAALLGAGAATARRRRAPGVAQQAAPRRGSCRAARSARVRSRACAPLPRGLGVLVSLSLRLSVSDRTAAAAPYRHRAMHSSYASRSYCCSLCHCFTRHYH